MKKRGQASLEYLTTYGWAFILIIVMIGALAYFGVLNPKKLLPGRCSFGAEIECKNYVLSSAGVRLRLKHNMGEPIVITNIKAITESQKLDCASAIIGATWNTDSTVDANIQCNLAGLIAGEKEKVSLELTYYKVKSGTTYNNIVSGEILGKVDSDAASTTTTTTTTSTTTTTTLPLAKSCKEHYDNAQTTDGTYTIYPDGSPLVVTCDMTRDNGGWTLVLWGLPTEAANSQTLNEKVALSKDIPFTKVRVEGVNINFRVTDTTSEPAILRRNIREYFREVVIQIPSTIPLPRVKFHNANGLQTATLVNNYFMTTSASSYYRIFYTCVRPYGSTSTLYSNYMYIISNLPTCTPRSTFNSVAAGCFSSSPDYCSAALSTSPTDPSTGLSQRTWQEAKVWVK